MIPPPELCGPDCSYICIPLWLIKATLTILGLFVVAAWTIFAARPKP